MRPSVDAWNEVTCGQFTAASGDVGPAIEPTALRQPASDHSVTKQTIGHVKPGRHTLKTEFVGPTHLPFRPRVIASVTFTVRR